MGRRARCRVRQTAAAGWASRLTAAVHGDRVAGADCPPQLEGVVDAVSVPQPCGDPRVSRQCHNSSKTRGPHPWTAPDCNAPLRTDTAGQGRYRGSSTQHPWTPIDRHGWAWAAYGSEDRLAARRQPTDQYDGALDTIDDYIGAVQ